MTLQQKNTVPNIDIQTQLDNCVKLKPDDLVISDIKWKYLVRSVLRGKNVLLTGPTGCAKTLAAVSSREALYSEYTEEMDDTQLSLLKLDNNIKIIKMEKIEG
jgi:hypothetical protein